MQISTQLEGFQLTTSQGGRLNLLSFRFRVEHFNSRPHKEVDMVVDPVSGYMVPFQLTTSQGGRRYTRTKEIYKNTFQLTTSQGGRHLSAPLRESCIYFNSRPHEEIDHVIANRDKVIVISTHDLTRRSTWQKDPAQSL